MQIMSVQDVLRLIQSSFSMWREPCNIYINTRKIYWHNHVNAVCCSRMGPAPHQGDIFFQNMRYTCWVYFGRSLPSLATVEFKFSKKSMKLARPCSCHAHVWILHHTSFKYFKTELRPYTAAEFIILRRAGPVLLQQAAFTWLCQ